ncbi:MAG: PLP-dependent aminotransferase family protein [Oscillospiraceae bacterium]|jgi:2-aminoadipate transaminase|nr:PLP-dependent aminotransferase family protein [Oscillospiraceae bacterium]
MEYNFANRISGLVPSVIREILKFTSNPDIISFAAGNPAPEAFPAKEALEISQKLFSTKPVDALQYGVTEGYAPLIEKITEYIKERYNVGRDFDSVIITSGAQQVMDLTTKVLCNEGDVIICEEPSFIGSLNCFKSYGAKLCGVEIEDDGININMLEEKLKEHPNAKFIYTIPNFQNPTGITMSLEKRKAVYALAKKYNKIILEDNPYGEIRVQGEYIPPIKSFDEEGIVIYAGSFSKLFSPGIRVGYVCAPKEILSKMTVGKQASDVHTTVFFQMLIFEWMSNYDIDIHIKNMQDIYRKKLNLMCDMLDSELAGFLSYNKPQGGMFIWAKLPDHVDMLEFCKRAVKNSVAVVPGTAFMTSEDRKTNCIRLNFSTPSDDDIVKGVKILGKLAKEY